MKLVPLVGAIVLAIAVVACTGCGNDVGGGARRDTLTIWVPAGPGEMAFFRKVGNIAEQALPDLSLDWKAVRISDLKPSFLGNAERLHEPDLILLVNDWIGELDDRGLLAPIPASFPDIHPAMMSGVTLAGRLLAVPWSFETLALFSNTDLVATPPRTLAELLERGEEIRSRCLFPLVYENRNFYFHAPFFFGGGGRLFGPDGRVDLATPEFEASLHLARRLQFERRLVPAKCNYPAMINLFGRGRVGMIMTGPWSIPEIERSPVRFTVSPLPDLSATQPARPFLGIKAFAVNARSRHLQAAMRLLPLLGSKKLQMEAARDLGLLPCCRVGTDIGALSLTQQVFLTAAEDGVPLLPTLEMSAVWKEAAWVLNQAVAEHPRPDAEILAEAQRRLELPQGGSR